MVHSARMHFTRPLGTRILLTLGTPSVRCFSYSFFFSFFFFSFLFSFFFTFTSTSTSTSTSVVPSSVVPQ